MNIAFEISPLITASGTFGDKSGVYRYMYNLILSYSQYLDHIDSKDRIILFSYNKDLLRLSLSTDFSKLISKKNIILISKFKENSYFKQDLLEENDFFNSSIIYHIINALQKIFKIKNIYVNIVNRLAFKDYISELSSRLLKYKVSAIIDSETGFYPLKKFKHVMVIYDLTPHIFPEFHRPDTIDLHRRKLKFAKRYCQGIICISQRTKKDLLRYSSKFESKNISIIYPQVDNVFTDEHIESHQEYTFKDINSIIKNNHILPKKYLLYYGTFEPRKNILNLVKVFTDLYEKCEIPQNIKLVLCGGYGWGSVRGYVEAFIRENYPIASLSPIIVLNYIKDNYLKKLIKNAYMVIYPSFYEGFGLPVLESMVLGTPVICSRTSSLPEVGGDATLYINPKNLDELKDKIKLLFDKPDLVKELIQKGKIQATKFQTDKSTDKLHQFFNKL